MHAATVVFTRVLLCNPCISCVCTCKGQRPVASGSRNPFSHPCTHSWHLAAAAQQLYVCMIMCVLPASTFAAREEGQTAQAPIPILIFTRFRDFGSLRQAVGTFWSGHQACCSWVGSGVHAFGTMRWPKSN